MLNHHQNVSAVNIKDNRTNAAINMVVCKSADYGNPEE